MDRIYTGFESLDKHLKIYKGDLVVIGGRPAIGKTCLMCSMIEKTIDKQKTLFFTMQTNKHKAIERLQLLNVKENDNFYLYDDFVDYEELLLIVAEHKIKYDIGVVFIDNAVDLFNNTCHSEVETTVKLKRIAEKLNVPANLISIISYLNLSIFFVSFIIISHIFAECNRLCQIFFGGQEKPVFMGYPKVKLIYIKR